MKYIVYALLYIALISTAFADTPPPGTVKAKTWSGDGNTAVTVTGTALDVNVKNSSIPVTGTFWQSVQPVSGTVSATNPSVGATGASVPASATLSGGKDGSGNLKALSVSSVGVLAVDASSATVPVSGSFWQTTQPISGTVTANAGTGTLLVDGSAHTQPVSGTFWQATQPVSGTFWQATQPISAASLPLPSGAATAVKQPALGVAGTPSLDVITVQGAATMEPLIVDGSGSTQPVSGTVTANAGTGTFTVDGSGHTQPVSGTFWQATQPVSGTFWQATQPVSGTVTANAGTGTFTVDASGHSVPVTGTFWQATQPVSIATAPVLVAGSAIIGKVGIDQTTPGTTNGVQVNAALPAGSNVIGHVIADSGSTTVVTGTVAATQSGTWTVQPGNTANTTAWLVNSQAKTPTAVTVKAAAVTIGTSAVRLTNDGLAPAATRVLLVAQLLSSSTANCFLGPSGVASSGASRGIQMFAGQSFSFNNDAGDYYAICDASSQTFLITEQE